MKNTELLRLMVFLADRDYTYKVDEMKVCSSGKSRRVTIDNRYRVYCIADKYLPDFCDVRVIENMKGDVLNYYNMNDDFSFIDGLMLS